MFFNYDTKTTLTSVRKKKKNFLKIENYFLMQPVVTYTNSCYSVGL